MDVSLMTTLRFTRWRRSGTLLASGLLAGFAIVSMAGPAMADPSPVPGPSSSPSKAGGTPTATPPGSITWAVQPSTKDGPDRRSSFTYTNLKPGTIVHDYVGVTNYSKTAVTFRVYASDAFNTSTGSLDLLPANEKPKDVGSWVGLGKDSVTIEPGARVNEPFTLTVPDNATPGDHTGGIIASISTTSSGGKGNVNVDRRLAVPIYLRVAGALTPAVAIESLSASYHGTINPFGGGGTDVSYTIHNTGNARLNLSQGATLTSFGITLGTAHPPSLTDLLPGATYRVTQHLSGVFPLGPISAKVHVDPAAPAGLPRADPPLTPVSHDLGLWATPWPQLLVLAVLIGLFFAIRWWIRRGKRRTESAVAAAVQKARREAAEELTGAGATSVGAGAAEADPKASG
jgi:hypothetical protein